MSPARRRNVKVEEAVEKTVERIDHFIVLAMGYKPSPSGESFRFYGVRL
jgi:hypothetical protein